MTPEEESTIRDALAPLIEVGQRFRERAERAEAEAAKLREALRPFAHDAFQDALSGQIQGDDSPMWGRQGQVLTLGDFRRARAAIRADAAREEKR